MAKKRPTKKADTTTSQHCFRLPDDETLRLEAIAEMEGFKTVASWAQDLVRRRGQLMENHLRDGTFVVIRGLHVPWTEVPGSDINECRLANSERLLLDQSTTDERLNDVSGWLYEVAAHGTDAHRKRAVKLAERLPDNMREPFFDVLHGCP